MNDYISFKNNIAGYEDVVTTLKDSINSLLNFYSPPKKMLNPKTLDEKILIVITGEKGLVGDMYHTLISHLTTNSSKYTKLISVGSKGKERMEEEGVRVFASFEFSENIEEVCENVVQSIWKLYGQKPCKVDILYPECVSISQQQPAIVSFLPFSGDIQGSEQSKPKNGLPIFGTSKKKIFTWLFQEYLKTYVYSLMLKSKLSELSSRTVATEHAQKKTDELVKHMKLKYLKDRRINMTQKQLESFSAHSIV